MTPSEAIRRALLAMEEQELEATRSRARRERVLAFKELVRLFRGHDPKDELAQIRADRDAWRAAFTSKPILSFSRGD